MANIAALADHSRTTADRRIPDTWFRAQASSTTMGFVMQKCPRTVPLSDGERQLGMFVLPPFQRPPVWTRAQQARFIESCWMGLPIGAFTYNQPDNFGSRTDMWLIDGQQRMTAVYAYLADEFPVLGYCYSELTEVDHRKWHMSTSFPSLITRLTDEAELREVYDRLAYGGTPHEQPLQ